MPDMVFSDVGPVSAYAIAKEHGYMGTEQEWAQEQAAAGTYARAAKLEKEGAERARAQAEEAAAAAAKSDSAASQKVIDANNAADRAADSAQAAEGSARTAAAHETETGKQAAAAAASAEGAEKSAEAAKAEADRAVKAADRADAAAQHAETIIDDTALVDNKTWSSKNIVDRLASPFNKKAPIVQGELVAGYPMSVKSYIEPIQKKNDRPQSPENRWPIYGVTELKMIKCSKNILKSTIANQTINGITIRVNEDGSFHISGTAEKRAEPIVAQNFLLKKGTYISGFSKELIVQTDKGYITTVAKGKLIVPDDRNVFQLRIRIEEGTTVDEMVYPQLEVGSTATLYEPYHGKTFTQTLPKEVLGGVYEWNSGKLIEEYIWFTGERFLNVGARSVSARENMVRLYNTIVVPNSKIYSEGLPIFENADAFVGSEVGIYKADKGNLDILVEKEDLIANGAVDGEKSTYAAAFEKWFRAQGGKIAYQTTKPKVIQLMPDLTEVFEAEEGITTVYSSAGDTEVTARKDPNAERAQMQRDIAALQKAQTNL